MKRYYEEFASMAADVDAKADGSSDQDIKKMVDDFIVHLNSILDAESLAKVPGDRRCGNVGDRDDLSKLDVVPINTECFAEGKEQFFALGGYLLEEEKVFSVEELLRYAPMRDFVVDCREVNNFFRNSLRVRYRILEAEEILEVHLWTTDGLKGVMKLSFDALEVVRWSLLAGSLETAPIWWAYKEGDRFRRVRDLLDKSLQPVLASMCLGVVALFARIRIIQSEREIRVIEAPSKRIPAPTPAAERENHPAETAKKARVVELGGALTVRTYRDDTVRALRKRRKCAYSFGVMGHWRHYRSGKDTWISPYVKNKGAEKQGRTYVLP